MQNNIIFNSLLDPGFGAMFVTTWDTTGPGSAENVIIIPTDEEETYDCRVFWGDGDVSTVSGSPANIIHTYSTPGQKTIKIAGTFPHIYFNNDGDILKLLYIDNWGDIVWTSFNSAFSGCASMRGRYTDDPCTSAVTDMSFMFTSCESFNYPINLDTHNVTDMSYMFSGSAFNQSVASFNTSNVTNMKEIFGNCPFDQPIDNFDTTNVTNMDSMFNHGNFDQSLNNLNTANVTDMQYMFSDSSFNQPVNNFDTGSVDNMRHMFSSTRFNQPISNFDTANVTNMSSMFEKCSFNQSLSNFNTAGVTNMSGMFMDSSFNQSLSNFNTSIVTNMSNMFTNNYSFKQDVSNFNIESISSSTNGINNMFTDININDIGTINYDRLLISWAAQDVSDDLVFNAGNSQYSAVGSTARAHLVDTHTWDITDGGTV